MSFGGDLSNARASRIFVVAGNYAEYETYRRNKMLKDESLKSNDFCFVSSRGDLYGLTEMHGVFVGTYKDRPDIHDVCKRIKIVNKLPTSAELFPGEKLLFLEMMEKVRQPSSDYVTPPTVVWDMATQANPNYCKEIQMVERAKRED